MCAKSRAYRAGCVRDRTGYPPEEYEIFGQRFDASGGDPLGGNFRISYLGTDGDSAFDVQAPAVAFNSLTNEYLVTWSGSLSGENDFPSNYEIMGQRLDGGGGGPLGTAIRISDMGPESDNSFRATDPTVAFNSIQNEYLVAWVGTDDGAGLAASEREIYAQRLTALGADIGDNDVRISDMGPMETSGTTLAGTRRLLITRLRTSIWWFGQGRTAATSCLPVKTKSSRRSWPPMVRTSSPTIL